MGRRTAAELEQAAALDDLQRSEASAARAPLVSYLVGFAVLLALGAVNQVAFRWLFDTSHLDWYLRNGALIGFVTSVVGITWGDINRNADLISAHPARYLRGCCWLVGLPFFALGTHLRSGDPSDRPRAPLDLLLTLAFSLVIGLLLLVWVVVVVPLQYAVYLVCGAPARLYAQSSWRPVARVQASGGMVMEELHVSEPVPRGWWEASLFSRPVSSTALMTSLFFLLLKPLLA